MTGRPRPSGRVAAPAVQPNAAADAAYLAAVKTAVYSVKLAFGSPTQAAMAGMKVPRPPWISISEAQSIVSSVVQAAYAPTGVGVGDVLGIAGHYIAHPAEGVKTSAGFLGGVVTGWVGDLVRALVPILKIGAGGVGLLVSGVALVYIAGRNVPSSQAGSAVRTVVQSVPAGRAAVRKKRSTVSESEFYERRGMERASRQMGRKETTYEGLGERLPRKRKTLA